MIVNDMVANSQVPLINIRHTNVYTKLQKSNLALNVSEKTK